MYGTNAVVSLTIIRFRGILTDLNTKAKQGSKAKGIVFRLVLRSAGTSIFVHVRTIVRPRD